jgi:hypothetical protein
MRLPATSAVAASTGGVSVFAVGGVQAHARTAAAQINKRFM